MDYEKMKRQIESTFDQVSKRYDENRFFNLSARKMAEMIPIKKNIKVLDVSTGTGEVAIAVARKNQQATIEAIDLSLGMLTQAKIKAENEYLKNINFKQYDAEKLPYGQNTFDVITCGYALFFYPDMELTYKSLCRKIKRGGRFIFSSFTRDAFNPYAELFLQRLEKDYQIEAPKASRKRLKTIKQMKALAELSEPQKIEIEHYPIRYPITVEEWWSLLNNAGYKGLLDQLNKGQYKEFKQKHMEEINTIAIDGFLDLNSDTLFGVVDV